MSKASPKKEEVSSASESSSNGRVSRPPSPVDSPDSAVEPFSSASSSSSSPAEPITPSANPASAAASPSELKVEAAKKVLAFEAARNSRDKLAIQVKKAEDAYNKADAIYKDAIVKDLAVDKTEIGGWLGYKDQKAKNTALEETALKRDKAIEHYNNTRKALLDLKNTQVDELQKYIELAYTTADAQESIRNSAQKSASILPSVKDEVKGLKINTFPALNSDLIFSATALLQSSPLDFVEKTKFAQKLAEVSNYDELEKLTTSIQFNILKAQDVDQAQAANNLALKDIGLQNISSKLQKIDPALRGSVLELDTVNKGLYKDIKSSILSKNGGVLLWIRGCTRSPSSFSGKRFSQL